MAIEKQEFRQSLGLMDATTIVMGSMIGSGIFIVSADIARQVASPGLLLVTWIATALLTLIAALSYGELAAMMPQAGGQYVYLREAFGPLSGFLYGWTFFTVIQTGTIAAVAVAFAKFAGVLWPFIAAEIKILPFLSTQQLTGIVIILLLTWVNLRGVRTGAAVQNIFTIAKTGALAALIIVGFLAGRNPAAVERNFTDLWAGAAFQWDVVRLVGVAMVGALFSSDSWNNVTFIAGEVKNPKRNIPLALALGTAAVSVLYILCNVVYLNVLPLEQIQTAPQDRVATAVVGSVFGASGAVIMAAAIMVSTFGCINGLVLAGARAYYAMALDGLFFKQVAALDPKTGVPAAGLILQGLLAALWTLSGKYGDLLDGVIFAVLVFYVLTILGVFVLRHTRPDAARPYKAFGYPFLPALYIILGSLIAVLLLLYKPDYTRPGFVIVLTGIPVYYLALRQGKGKTE